MGCGSSSSAGPSNIAEASTSSTVASTKVAATVNDRLVSASRGQVAPLRVTQDAKLTSETTDLTKHDIEAIRKARDEFDETKYQDDPIYLNTWEQIWETDAALFPSNGVKNMISAAEDFLEGKGGQPGNDIDILRRFEANRTASNAIAVAALLQITHHKSQAALSWLQLAVDMAPNDKLPNAYYITASKAHMDLMDFESASQVIENGFAAVLSSGNPPSDQLNDQQQELKKAQVDCLVNWADYLLFLNQDETDIRKHLEKAAEIERMLYNFSGWVAWRDENGKDMHQCALSSMEERNFLAKQMPEKEFKRTKSDLMFTTTTTKADQGKLIGHATLRLFILDKSDPNKLMIHSSSSFDCPNSQLDHKQDQLKQPQQTSGSVSQSRSKSMSISASASTSTDPFQLHCCLMLLAIKGERVRPLEEMLYRAQAEWTRKWVLAISSGLVCLTFEPVASTSCMRQFNITSTRKVPLCVGYIHGETVTPEASPDWQSAEPLAAFEHDIATEFMAGTSIFFFATASNAIPESFCAETRFPISTRRDDFLPLRHELTLNHPSLDIWLHQFHHKFEIIFRGWSVPTHMYKHKRCWLDSMKGATQFDFYHQLYKTQIQRRGINWNLLKWLDENWLARTSLLQENIWSEAAHDAMKTFRLDHCHHDKSIADYDKSALIPSTCFDAALMEIESKDSSKLSEVATKTHFHHISEGDEERHSLWKRRSSVAFTAAAGLADLATLFEEFEPVVGSLLLSMLPWHNLHILRDRLQSSDPPARWCLYHQIGSELAALSHNPKILKRSTGWFRLAIQKARSASGGDFDAVHPNWHVALIDQLHQMGEFDDSLLVAINAMAGLHQSHQTEATKGQLQARIARAERAVGISEMIENHLDQIHSALDEIHKMDSSAFHRSKALFKLDVEIEQLSNKKTSDWRGVRRVGKAACQAALELEHSASSSATTAAGSAASDAGTGKEDDPAEGQTGLKGAALQKVIDLLVGQASSFLKASAQIQSIVGFPEDVRDSLFLVEAYLIGHKRRKQAQESFDRCTQRIQEIGKEYLPNDVLSAYDECARRLNSPQVR